MVRNLRVLPFGAILSHPRLNRATAEEIFILRRPSWNHLGPPWLLDGLAPATPSHPEAGAGAGGGSDYPEGKQGGWNKHLCNHLRAQRAGGFPPIPHPPHSSSSRSYLVPPHQPYDEILYQAFLLPFWFNRFAARVGPAHFPPRVYSGRLPRHPLRHLLRQAPRQASRHLTFT